MKGSSGPGILTSVCVRWSPYLHIHLCLSLVLCLCLSPYWNDLQLGQVRPFLNCVCVHMCVQHSCVAMGLGWQDLESNSWIANPVPLLSTHIFLFNLLNFFVPWFPHRQNSENTKSTTGIFVRAKYLPSCLTENDHSLKVYVSSHPQNTWCKESIFFFKVCLSRASFP